MSFPNRRLLRYASADIWALSQNAAHQGAARYALSLYALDAVYSFIPKNACSTLRYSLALANGVLSGPEQFNWIHTNNPTFAPPSPSWRRPDTPSWCCAIRSCGSPAAISTRSPD